MSSQLATIQANAVATDGMFSDARITMIRNTVAKGAPDDVFFAMVDIAKRRNLDPLAKQIIVAKIGGSWVYIVTIDGYRSTAEQTGQYAGNDEPVFTYADPPEKTRAGKVAPDSASITVYKMVNGVRCPFSATVYWEEYNAGQNNWNTMPRTMLAKVAESHALRKAFPSVLSGTYTQEEMDQANRRGEVIDVQTGEIQGGAPVARLEAPTRAPNPVSGTRSPIREPRAPEASTDADWKRAAARFHAVLNEIGVKDDGKRAFLRSQDVESTKEVDAATLKAWAKGFEDDPEGTREYIAGMLYNQAMEGFDEEGANAEIIEGNVSLIEVQQEFDDEMMPGTGVIPNPDRHTQ